MNLKIIQFELKQQYRQTIYWGIIVGCLFLMYISFYQLFKDSIHVFMTSIPKEMIQVLGLSDFNHFLGYYIFILQMLMIVLGIYSSMVGIKSMNLESQNHLSDFLFTKPVKRSTVFHSKVIQLIIQIILFWMVQTVIIVIGILLFVNETVKIRDFMMIQWMILMLCILIMMLSIFITRFIESKIKPIYQGIVIGLGLYLIKIVSSITQNQVISFFSVYDYFKWDLLASGHAPDFKLVIMILMMIMVCYIGTLSMYQRKEFTS